MDSKALDRVRKLLNLARDGAATEHEAALATERARAIMEEHGLSMAAVETAGGESEARGRHEFGEFAQRPWMRTLMEALAEAHSCYHELLEGGRDRMTGDRRPPSWILIGRESSVAACRVMHEYLVQTVRRVAKENPVAGRVEMAFRNGMADRVAERIRDRHRNRLREQREEAEQRRRQQEAAARHPGAAPAGTALVVFYDDYVRNEHDLNEDVRRGVPAGTTRREREQEAARARARAEEREAKIRDLLREGVSEDVAYYVAHVGMTLERATAYVREREAAAARQPSAEERERQARARQREHERWRRRQQEQSNREWRRTANPAYRAGRAEGDRVSLDDQIEKRDTRRIT